MRILLIITGLGVGGAERVVTNLADELVSRGNYVKIAYLTGDASILPKNSNIEVIPLNLVKVKDLPKVYYSLNKLVYSFKPDVIHSHMFHANILSRLLRLTTKVPKVICTSHSIYEGGRARMWTYRITDRLATISTNVSQQAVKALISQGAVSSKKMISIPNGVDTNIFNHSTELRAIKRKELNINNKLMILAVGRMDVAKDYPTLLKTIALLKESRDDFILYIAGDGPLRDELVRLAETLMITKYIVMLGVRNDIPELMFACDTFVLSSAWEGFGLVVAEAMACECTVVATDCGGVSEVLGSDGFLVKPKDSSLLAQALNKALDLRDNERADMGASARKRIIEKFSLEANVNAYFDLYSS